MEELTEKELHYIISLVKRRVRYEARRSTTPTNKTWEGLELLNKLKGMYDDAITTRA